MTDKHILQPPQEIRGIAAQPGIGMTAILEGSMSVVDKARQADGCLDSAITADLRDPGRVNLFERRESQAAVKPLRRRGPRNKRRAAVLSVSVAEYDIADVRPLFGKGRP